MEERRRYPRLVKPFDATLSGRGGTSRCRVADISWGGCFIEIPSQPAVGERIVITIALGDTAVALAGLIIYSEQDRGFGMKFDTLTADQLATLQDLLGDLPESLK